ncbi:MAG: DUF4337 domain-containing protein [candidate division FCPU426 bacterium]
MPEEIEVPTEHLHEAMQEAAEHGGGGFNLRVALSSAVLAVMAAICALMAGHHANEALIDRIQASDQWNFYQAKGIKASVLGSKLDTLKALNKKTDPKEAEKIEEYKKEQAEIKEKAEEKEHGSEAHLGHHVTLAKAVTLFQVAIALSAMAVLTRRRELWWISLCLGGVGAWFFVTGIL